MLFWQLAHLRIRGLCGDRVVRRQQAATGRLFSTTRGKHHDRGWHHHGGSTAQCKPSSSPYRIRGRVIWLRRQMTFIELTSATWHGIMGGCLYREMPRGATFHVRLRTKNRALGPMRLGMPSHPRPPVEIVGKFQILVKLNSMNMNTSVSIARILLAFLSTITKYGGFKSIPGNSARNACWHFLVLSLRLS